MGVAVGVLGAGGRMGTEVCRTVAADAELSLVAAVDPGHVGEEAPGGLVIAGGVDALASSGAEVAVHFTLADAVMGNLRWCAANGVHAVVGTSGLTEADLAELASVFGDEGGPNCLVAPNFAVGAVLLMRFAEMAAPFFETAEVIELHHDGKIDAPSGTALTTAERMAAASSAWAPDPTTREVLDGARGGAGAGGIRVHSVRLRGLVAHQEVLLGTTGQTLTIRHDSTDRTSFMPGVVLAVKAVAGLAGLTVGLDAALF